MTTPLVGMRQTKAPGSLEPGGLLAFEGRAGAPLLPFPCCYPPPALLWLCPVGQPPHDHAATHRRVSSSGLLCPPPGSLRRIAGRGERGKSGAYAPPALRQSNSGMPIALALSARLSVTPEPGNTTTPIGSASNSWSLRLNGAAF